MKTHGSLTEDSVSAHVLTHGSLTTGREGKGVDGKGREVLGSPKCSTRPIFSSVFHLEIHHRSVTNARGERR